MRFTIDAATGAIKPLEDKDTETLEDNSVELVDASYDTDPNALMPPGNLDIADQTVYIGSGGATNVDVTLVFDEVPGVEEYEVRVTR